MPARSWGCLLLLPFLLGFEGGQARDMLEAAFRNLYGSDLLAAVELTIEGPGHPTETLAFAFGRKRKGGETRTLLFRVGGGSEAPRALLLQRAGQGDRIFVSSGRQGRVRALPGGQRRGSLFGSDFTYDDFRAHRAEEFSIEVLGGDRIDGEPCRVLRLRPRSGPYTSILAWISTERPVFVRMDYFDRRGLWKRYRAKVAKLTRHFDAWVAMEDQMFDLRTGRETRRVVRNILIDTHVPDEVFTLTQLRRGRMPLF